MSGTSRTGITLRTLRVRGDPYHGNLPKRYVELPQICTQAKKLEHEVYDQHRGVRAVRAEAREYDLVR